MMTIVKCGENRIAIDPARIVAAMEQLDKSKRPIVVLHVDGIERHILTTTPLEEIVESINCHRHAESLGKSLGILTEESLIPTPKLNPKGTQ